MFGSASAIGETLRTMIPLILAGLSVAFAFRTGLFNIGVEGQLLVGWLCSGLVRLCSLTTSFPSYSIIYFICSIGGRNLGLHSGYLKGKFQVNEVIVTIMMNYIALYVTYDIIKRFYMRVMTKRMILKRVRHYLQTGLLLLLMVHVYTGELL